MAGFREWAKSPRFRIGAAVVVAAVAVGGILLGINLSSTTGSASPATASAGAKGSSARGSDSSDTGSQSSSTGSGSTGGASGSGPATGGGPSTSVAPQKVAVICTTASGNVSGTVTIRTCSRLPATGGSGTFPGALLEKSGSGTITWNGTGTTTFVYVFSHPASQRHKCPQGDTETTLRGSVTANAPIGVGTAGVKGAVHAKLCIDPQLNVSLLGGRAFQL